MSIKQTVESMEQNLQSVWSSIKDEGGELPRQLNITNLAPAIRSIGGNVPIFNPDLSKVLDANFVTYLANAKTQTYSADDSTDAVYDKLFAPSLTQLAIL